MPGQGYRPARLYCQAVGAVMKPAVIYDFHGTLGDVSGVRHFLRNRDYESFYTQSLVCPPIADTVQAARRSHRNRYANILFTGMPVKYADGLNDWLVKHRVPITHIAMRKDDDRRKDFIVKKEMYLDVVARGYYIVRAWEDSPRVVDLWGSLGIPVDVIPGYDENLIVGEVDKPNITRLG